MVRKPGSGVAIEGSEGSYRKAIRAFINENIDTRILHDAYENEEDQMGICGGLEQSNIGQILNHDILKRVVNCIIGMKDERVMTLTENSYIGLVIHITIAINRILKHEIIEADARWSEELPMDEDYALAAKIAQELEKEFEVEIPNLEISYICLHIKGAKHEKIQWDGQKTVEIENRELQQLVNAMIDVFDPQNGFLLKQDEEFIQGLLAHLQPTFIRILHDMQITNPVLEKIKRDYPEIFARCIQVAQVLEQWIGKPVPEAETGFLTVHFGAALVRMEGKKEDIRQVRKMVYQYERTPEKEKKETGFSEQLEEINLVVAQINAVIKYMDFFKVDHYITFEELLIAIGEKLSPYRDRGKMIQEDIRRREKIASQIFAEFGFALLHTRTKGVVRPSFTVCMTKDLQPFRDPYFKKIRVVFIMLLPIDENTRINSEILGQISALLVEDSSFMDTVLSGDKEAIRAALSAHLKKFFNQYLARIS